MPPARHRAGEGFGPGSGPDARPQSDPGPISPVAAEPYAYP